MPYIEFFGIGFFVGTVTFLVLLVARRSYIAHRERRRAGLVAQLRPAAIAFVGGGDDAVPEYHGADAEVFAELLGNYTRLLRGDARTRIASYYERSGGVDEQVRRLQSRWAWKRATAAFTLGDMASKRAVPGLLAALDDNRRDVRMAAARSLGRSARILKSELRANDDAPPAEPPHPPPAAEPPSTTDTTITTSHSEPRQN